MYRLLLVTTLSHVSGGELSCSGRCHLLTPGAACQCTSWCEDFGGCCEDYHFLCDNDRETQPAVFTLPPKKFTTTATTHTSVTTTTVTMTLTRTISTTTVTTVTTVTTSLPLWKSVQIGSAVVKGSPKCQAFGPEKVQIQVGNQLRSMTLFLPEGVEKAPLWLAMHGTTNPVDYFLDYTGLREFAKANDIGLLALQALRNEENEYQFDVGRHSQPLLWMEEAQIHDVLFVKEALKHLLKLPCLSKRRVHCAGYSNGARFCMRLASEMSSVIASVAPVSGLRYPQPNHATRPIPILAFHGDADNINPFGGQGAEYWHESVPGALQNWAKFNHCYRSSATPKFLQEGVFSVASYTGCKDNATVQVMQMLGAGHQWPGATFAIGGLGPKSNVDANRMIFNFFAQHPLPRYIDINANLQLDAVHEVDKVDTDTSSSIFPVVLLSFAIVASIMLALVVFKMVSVRSYSPLGNPSAELLLD